MLYRGGVLLTSGDSVFGWATLPGTALWFVLGMGAAVVSVASEVDRRWSGVKRRLLDIRPGIWWGLALVLFIPLNLPFEAGGTFDPTNPGAPPSVPLDMLRYLLAGLVAICIFWPAVSGDQRRSGVRAFLAARPLAWLGLISYGIFLWHERVLEVFATRSPSEFFHVAFAGVGVIGVAAFSYYVVERPFLRRKPGISRSAKEEGTDRQPPVSV